MQTRRMPSASSTADKMGDRALTVNPARPREERSDYGGGSRGGYGGGGGNRSGGNRDRRSGGGSRRY